MFLTLSKDELFEVMKNLSYAFNWGWLKSERLAIEKYGLAVFLSEEFLKVFREFGSRQSRKLLELSIITGTGVDSIIKALQLSHWGLFENIKLDKLSKNVARMRTIECSLQAYTQRKLGTEYPCRNLHFALQSRKGFVQAINPKAEVTCNFSPPDTRLENIPKNVSCEWIITIPG
ncbi:MAG: DUF6125 family protein [Candidatus Bathyarchaeota archaeon]|jgi:hypothetical protein